jgi:hypothetical protein
MGIAGLVFFLQCMPPQALWDQEFEIERHCWNPMIATGLAISACGETDFRFSLLPDVVSYLYLPRLTRVAVSFLS